MSNLSQLLIDRCSGLLYLKYQIKLTIYEHKDKFSYLEYRKLLNYIFKKYLINLFSRLLLHNIKFLVYSNN